MTKPLEYRCQFCGRLSLRRDWKDRYDTCPKCGEKYDWRLAQDSEE